jgi:large subunit ribosomal protein L23
MQNTQGIVKRPIITEKATMASEQMNRFTFEVIQTANKIEIKNAIERMYGVQVTKVRTANFGGGKASMKYTNRGIVQEKAKKWKKAIVSVADGQTIDLFNNY